MTAKLAPTTPEESMTSDSADAPADTAGTGALSLASSREQLINLQRELLGRIKNTPEPNERDAFLGWVKQAVAGLNKTLWRRFQTDVQQLVSRYTDMQEQQQQQVQSRPGISSNKDSDPCSVQWQPIPSQWPSQVVCVGISGTCLGAAAAVSAVRQASV
ncbi:uncharacterized protein LOC132725086 [Ruditapes philippinarum]|uniref:uncharacterized protein LOC132725086 n=1 Tax=Ruditapes philippinarum TaxID=129788 RepID=UPI00295C2E1B|nr:uncharacterized protein LOC132725086 [Ruditapes philippinarum]